MADTTQSKNHFIELPKFKEKVMYVSKNDSKTKIESSYVISSSFKGILRLSPNNHTTVNERIITQLSPQDEKALGTTYSDAIVFEDQALQSIKSDADITRRLLIGSDSDGYLVNFRIGKEDIEFDKLGVIGITKSNELTLLTSKSNYRDDILTLNGTQMPSFAQTVQTSTPIQKDLLYKQEDGSYTGDVQKYLDMKDVIVTEKGDNSHLLYGILSNNKRVFKYKQTQKFIKDLIMQALMDLQTIPTGSIHFVPVNIEQYKALLGTGQRPNICSYYNGITTNKTDPIIRDFLLCDGREYYTADFPELAKTLWGQGITRWNRVKDDNFVGAYPQFDELCNVYQEQEDTKKTFRVPDLRHMFITSVYFNGSNSLSRNAETIDNDRNKTGIYTPDTLPINIKQYQSVDDHVHFIAYGTCGMVNRSAYTQNFGTKNVNGKVEDLAAVAQGTLYKVGNSEYTPDAGSESGISEHNAIKLKLIEGVKPRMMYLQNHPMYRNTDFGSGTTQSNGANGFSYGQFSPKRGCTWKNLRTNFAIPSIMYLSMPGGGETSNRKSLLTKFENTSLVGYSSVQIPSINEVKDNDVYGAKNNVLRNERYTAFNDKIYGHESTPKFYAMLPLIKI